MRYRITFFIFAILITGCVTVETCDESTDSELVASFKTLKEGIATDSMVNYLSVYGIREGMADSLIYDSIPASGFMVPLNPHDNVSRFVVAINDISDTLKIFHNQESYMISYTCGFGIFFTLETITHSNYNFKSDSIISTLVDASNEDNEEHIWLYL